MPSRGSRASQETSPIETLAGRLYGRSSGAFMWLIAWVGLYMGTVMSYEDWMTNVTSYQNMQFNDQLFVTSYVVGAIPQVAQIFIAYMLAYASLRGVWLARGKKVIAGFHILDFILDAKVRAYIDIAEIINSFTDGSPVGDAIALLVASVGAYLTQLAIIEVSFGLLSEVAIVFSATFLIEWAKQHKNSGNTGSFWLSWIDPNKSLIPKGSKSSSSSRSRTTTTRRETPEPYNDTSPRSGEFALPDRRGDSRGSGGGSGRRR